MKRVQGMFRIIRASSNTDILVCCKFFLNLPRSDESVIWMTRREQYASWPVGESRGIGKKKYVDLKTIKIVRARTYITNIISI